RGQACGPGPVSARPAPGRRRHPAGRERRGCRLRYQNDVAHPPHCRSACHARARSRDGRQPHDREPPRRRFGHPADPAEAATAIFLMAPIRVLIVDDHAVVRRGLRAFLDLQPDVEVVGEAIDGTSAEELAARLVPDVVLMDLVMPGTDGIATIRRLRNAVAGAAILVLTSYLDDVHVFAALEAGAAGYLLKDVQPDELVRAIRQTHQGESALHPKVAARLVQHTLQPASLAYFTPRELAVLRLLAEALPSKDVARRLLLSAQTVMTHDSIVLQKLGVTDRTQAALLAVRRGLVE